MKYKFHILLLLVLAVACTPNQRPERKPLADTSFDKAYSRNYGAHYLTRGIEQNVIDLDLYSGNLGLDSANHIVGTGTNLYLSDIFIPASENKLHDAEGEELIFASDTTGAEYTFLPGVDYDGNISGAYLLNITEGNLTSYTVFDEGSFTVNHAADTTRIHFVFKYTQSSVRLTYEADFCGVIEYDRK